jgi:acyl dehydratase
MNDYRLPPNGSEADIRLRFSQVDFDLFALLSGDDNPIHVDPDFAAGTRFGRTVAHGMLLFAATSAAINRWVAGPLNLHGIRLMFPAPTFAEENLDLHLAIPTVDSPLHRRVEISLGNSFGETCRGHASIGFDERAWDRDPPPDEATSDTEPLKGMRVGMSAERRRVLKADEVLALTELVEDPHPDYRGDRPVIPPALLGGMISDLLGVSLPGPGANWLKQTCRFRQPVSTGEEVRASVTITRLRPEKNLVNLSTTCETDDGAAMTGEALVLAGDVTDRDSTQN